MYSGNAYNSFGNHNAYSGGYNSVSTANISYETNSKDPVLLRARVFVGNLSPKVGRDEIIQLFRSYGTLLGVTVFKGFAFVQFSHGSEADLSVSSLNGFNWLNNILDVKLAISGQQQQHHPKPTPSHHISQAVVNAPKGMGKRIQNQFVPPIPNHKDQKRAKVDQGGGGGALLGVGGGHQQEKNNHNNSSSNNSNTNNSNDNNKSFALNSTTDLETHHHHESLHDTLICGECRFVTSDLGEFVEHRKQPCQLPKPDGEPDALLCNNCKEQYTTSWALLSHISLAHDNTLYKEVFYSKHDQNGAEEPIKPELDISMEQK